MAIDPEVSQTLSTPLIIADRSQQLREPRAVDGSGRGGLMVCRPVSDVTLDPLARGAIDFAKLLALLERSALIYDDDATVLRQRFPNIRCITTLCESGVRYALEEAPETGHQILTIRGTSNLKNSLQDLEYTFSYDGSLGVYTHRGINEDAQKILRRLLSDKVITLSQPIAITGHSLGGAIGNLLMCHLDKAGFKVLPSVTFGQPKVTNAKGVARYGDLPLTRVVYDNDIVPFLPPTTVFTAFRGPYQHMGSELILLKGKDYCFLDEHDAHRKSVNSFWKHMLHESFAEHHVDQYLEALVAKQREAKEVPYEKRSGGKLSVVRCLNTLPCCNC